MELGRFPVIKSFSVLFTWGGGLILLVAVVMFCGALLPTRENFPVNPNRDTNPIYQVLTGLGNLLVSLSLAGTGAGLLLTGEGLRLALAIEDRLFTIQADGQETNALLRRIQNGGEDKQTLSAILLLRDELSQLRFNTERTANATEVLSGTVQRRSGK